MTDRMLMRFNNQQLGVIKRLKKLGKRNIIICPECLTIFGAEHSDYVPYTSNSYIKCKKCGSHIYEESFRVDDLLRGTTTLDRENMHYFSGKHRQHSNTLNDNKLTKKQYQRINK